MVVVSCYQGNTNMGKVTCDDKSADQLKVGKLICRQTREGIFTFFQDISSFISPQNLEFPSDTHRKNQ